MRRGKGILCTAFLLMVFGVTTMLSPLCAEAGLSKVVLDDKTFEKELDLSLWNNPDEDILIKDGKLVFPEDSKDSTRLITRTTAKISEYCDQLADMKADLELEKLPDGENFALAFGLESAESFPGDPGNVEIQFFKKNGLQVQVVAYDEDGEKTSVMKAQACMAQGNKVSVDAKVSSDSILTLKVNGRKLCEEKLPLDGEGKIGFLQTGGCKVALSNVDIAIYQYDRPENCNVEEDFEKETFNAAALTSKMVYASNQYAPSKTYIDTIDGNRVFRFENAMVSYIGSCYEYSNFDLTFDVIGLQRVDERDKDGNIVVPRSMQFAVSYGDEAADYSDNGYVNSTDILVFGDSSVLSYYTNQSVSAADKGYDYHSADCNRDFTVRVSMKDSVVTVGMKWIDEKNFTDIMKYQVSEKTPTGYVHIWTTSVVANFSIDNLKLTNTDKEPNLIEAPFESSAIEVPADYNYQKMDYTYTEQKVEKKFNPYLIIPALAVVCVGAITISWFVTRKKVKGGAKNESE